MSNIPGFKDIPEQQENKYLKNAAAHVPGISNEKCVQYYSEWSTYDNDLNLETYRGPKIASNFCDVLLFDKASKIVDVGAGTGFVGDFLKKTGFTNVDALEPAEGLLEQAKQKKLYKNHILEGISKDKPTSVAEGTYDAVVIAGAMGEGHIPSEGVKEFARMAKKDGYVIIVMRKEYLAYVEEYIDRLVPMMEQLVKDGVWSPVLNLEVPNYSFNKTGCVFIYRKN